MKHLRTFESKRYDNIQIDEILDILLKYKSDIGTFINDIGWVHVVGVFLIDLSKISSYDLGIIDNIKKYIEWIYNIDEEDEMKIHRIYIPFNPKKDESKIKFHVACGLATTRSSPVLTSEIKIGYERNYYDRYRYYYYLSYDWNFSFAENGDRRINGFLNLSTLETQFVPRLKAMGGIDMGYLVFRQGDVFEKNTFRIGLAFKGDFFYVSPQLYFPGSFKGVYPGIRVNVGI